MSPQQRTDAITDPRGEDFGIQAQTLGTDPERSRV